MTADAARRLRLASRAAPRSLSASRRAAIRRAPIASSLPREGQAGAVHSATCCLKLTASATQVIARSPSQACTSARMAATSRTGRRLSSCCKRLSGAVRACGSASARSNRWIAPTRSSTSWRRRRLLRRIFICRCSTQAMGCSSRCAGRTRLPITGGWSIAYESASRTHQSAQTSSSGFPVKPIATSRCSRRICAIRRLRTCTCFRIQIGPAPRRVNGLRRCTARSFAIARAPCAALDAS